MVSIMPKRVTCTLNILCLSVGWLVVLEGVCIRFEEEEAVSFPVTGTDRCEYLLSSVTVVMLLAVTTKFS